ncbi:MAG: DNA polymerase IV [Flavisolibacter sp.]
MDHIPTSVAFRKIIHIDMDAFYASVEQRDHPELRGKPIAVGGSPEGRGGVIATASYEARRFGVRSAMPSKKAIQLCPQLVFVKPRFEVYKQVSENVREIFSRYTDLIEPLSLDEAYLDVTVDKKGMGSAMDIASEIRSSIKEELGLTASAGVSINKFIAKIASDMNKPDGLTFIGPSRVQTFVEGLAVEKFFGVGEVTARKMKSMNLHTGADLKRMTEAELVDHFGKIGRFFFQIVRGIDDRKVEPRQETKSVGAEDTFPFDLTGTAEMNEALNKLAAVVHNRLVRHGLKGRTITLKIKYSDFRVITRSRSFSLALDDLTWMADTARDLLLTTEPENKPVRLLGITISNFGFSRPGKFPVEGRGQLGLFDQAT